MGARPTLTTSCAMSPLALRECQRRSSRLSQQGTCALTRSFSEELTHLGHSVPYWRMSTWLRAPGAMAGWMRNPPLPSVSLSLEGLVDRKSRHASCLNAVERDKGRA